MRMLIGFTALLSTNAKTFAIECWLIINRMFDGETPFKTIHESGLVRIFWIFCLQKCHKNNTTLLRYFREWMLTRNIKCARLTEIASVSFLTHGWIKWSKISSKVDSQQHTPIEGETGRYDYRISLKVYLTKGKLLYKLKSVKPLSKEHAKQKGQNTGECTICPLKFQNFHVGEPHTPLYGRRTPPPTAPPLSYASYGCAMLRYTTLWKYLIFYWVIVTPGVDGWAKIVVCTIISVSASIKTFWQ